MSLQRSIKVCANFLNPIMCTSKISVNSGKTEEQSIGGVIQGIHTWLDKKKKYEGRIIKLNQTLRIG